VFEAIGTRWTVTTDVPLDDGARALVTAELARIDTRWSRFRPDSRVAEMSRRAGCYPIDPADRPLLDWYRRLYDATGGSVTPLVGVTLADAGYDAQYSLVPRETVRPVPDWDAVLIDHGDHLQLREPVLLDVGAAGKGFAVDRVADIVDGYCDEWIVDAGGDMVFSARAQPVRVALEHPLDPAKAIGLTALRGGSVCASAGNRRAWAGWHHIVDPHTTAPAREVLASWAVAPSALIADGLATALFFVPADTLRARLNQPFGHLVVRGTGAVDHAAFETLELFT